MRKHLIGCLLWWVGCSTIHTSLAQTDSLHIFLQQKLHQIQTAGFAAGIVVGEELVWAKGYGYADLARNKPFTPSTIMNIASISKTVTGVALMQAVEQGLIALDHDLNDYLPFEVRNPHFPDQPITPRHLASHTAGIRDRLLVYEASYYPRGKAHEELGPFLRSYFEPTGRRYRKRNFYKQAPGTHYAYSNIGAGLAGYLLEVRSGMGFNAFTASHIFQPLGMNHTGWFYEEVDMNEHATLYSGRLKPKKLYRLATYPDGGLRTSVTDLSKFLSMLMNHGVYKGRRILSAESVQQMLTPYSGQDEASLQGSTYGLFVSIRRTRSGDLLKGHTGGDPGVRTFMFFMPEEKVRVLLLFNTKLNKKSQAEVGSMIRRMLDAGLAFRAAQR
ncbi:MAG: class A beta-lactamase-related serine hydrolase [Bacteroidetes bacterium]|nr:MAG: class A beta-lactamase-related serine hydrolase [Bacteroidota bacterium]